MDKTFCTVIPNPSLNVILSEAKNLAVLLRAGSVRNLVFSERDCHVAPLLTMAASKESLNLDLNFFSSTVISACLESFFSPSFLTRGKGRLPNKKFSS